MSEITVYNPYDLSELEKLPTIDANRVEALLAKADRLHKEGAMPAEQRTGILDRAAGMLAGRIDEFAMSIAKEGGKPLTDSRVEAERAVDGIKNAIQELHTMAGREIPMRLNSKSANRLAFTTRQPIGPVVAVSAFNHPLNLIVHQVVPAVAVGCPVIVKPASTTPLTCIKFIELLREAGLPDEWCEVALVDNDMAEKLVTDNRVAFFSFIGSSKVGWMLRSKLAPGTRCALEHGGVAPAIVERDADLGAAIPSLVKAGYYHAGQVCVSTQRIYVHDSIIDSIAHKFVATVDDQKVGDPTQKDTEVGPLILPREVDRVAEWVDEAVEVGGKLLTGGKRLGETTYAPTVLLNPPDNVRLSREEVFGPVTAIYTFSDPAEAVQRANKLDVSFQAAVFSQDIDRALYYAKNLNGAAVMINDHTAFRVDWMPFAGYKHSGYGTGGIPYTMEDMTQEKLIVIKSSSL